MNEVERNLQAELARLKARVAELEQAQSRANHTEEALRQTQALLASFYDSSSLMMGLVEIVGDDIRHLSDNLAAASFFGWRVEELRGKLASELGVSPEHIREWLYYYRESARLNAPVHFEYSHQTPQGLVWLAATVCPVPDHATTASFTTDAQAKQPRHFSYMVEDITQRRAIEEQLRASEAKYKLLFQIYPLGICITDEAGHLLEVNPAFEELAGSNTTELAKRTVADNNWQLIRPDGTPLPPQERVSVTALAEKRLISQVEQGVVRPDGQVRWLSVTAAPLPMPGYGVAVAYADITHIKEMEAERLKLIEEQNQNQLRQSEARFRALFENAAVGIAQVGLDGSWHLVNERLCQIVGYSKDELVTLTFQDITHHADLEADLELVQQLLAGKRESYTLEKRYIRRDRTPVWINLTVALVRDHEGQPDFFISVVEDINQRKAAEEELRKSEETQRFLAAQLEIRANELEERVQERTRKLEEANRYKSQFLSQMSHELRTPLNSIMGFTTLLLQELPGSLNPEQKYQLGLVKGSAEQLLALISGLLDLARIESGKVTLKVSDFYPGKVLEHIVASVRPLAEIKHLGLDLDASEDIKNIKLHSDEVKFKQIILNLLSNAIKFTDTGGVKVQTSRISGAALEAAYARANEYWLPAFSVKSTTWPGEKPAAALLKVEVIDSGIGIAPAQLSQIFEEFGQLEAAGQRRQGGTGLGLAVTRRLAELLGGWLEVQSEVGQGSTFTLYLPLTDSLTRR